jgi:hypothetical protein
MGRPNVKDRATHPRKPKVEEPKTRRRLRRVRYEANVYIRGTRQEGAVVARAHNLSAEGIAVSALDLPPEGEEVECRLMLGGRRTRLRGRVAWVHRAPPAQRTLPAGGGIQFISLDRQERELLARLVDSANDGPQLVEVWVPGLEHPLPMRALIGTDEVKLGMALPQLVVGMPLRISFVHRGVSESRNGTIQAVRFLSGDRGSMSRVALQVSTPRPRDSAGMISTDGFEHRTVHSDERPSESMIFDLAAMTVPGSAGTPGSPLPEQVGPGPEEKTPIIPYEVYQQGQPIQPGQQDDMYQPGQPDDRYQQGYVEGGYPPGQAEMYQQAPGQGDPFGGAPRPSLAQRRWWIPVGLAVALIAAVFTGIAVSSRPAPPAPSPPRVRVPSQPVAPPRPAPAVPAPPRPAPPVLVSPPAGIQPLAPRAMDRAGARAAAAKRRKLRAAMRRRAAAQQLNGAGSAGPPSSASGRSQRR